MKVSQILIKCGLILLVLVTAILAVRAVFNYTEGRKLAKAVADLKDKGVPISAKDLAPPCPDRDNAARLWKAAENLLILEREDKEILSEFWTNLVNGESNVPARREDLANLIVKNELALRLVREMAEKPCFLYRDRADSLADTIRASSAIKMTLATRLLGLQAVLMAESGNVQGALEMLQRDLKFAPRISEEGLLIDFLIAIADTRMLIYSLAGVCQGQAVDEATLVSLIDGLDPGAWRLRMAQTISGERVSGLENGSDIITGRTSALAIEKGIDRLFYWLVRPILKAEIIWRLEQWNRWEQIADRPYFQQREALRTDAEYNGQVPWYFKFTGYQGGAYGTVFMKHATLEASLLATRSGLACRLYKKRNGSYPESLEALVPGILKEVPVDPFTGKPFTYRREGEGFIVYSLGSNEKDDGGRSTYMITQLVMDKDDDWTWKEEK
jgi:hypothetical protein